MRSPSLLPLHFASTQYQRRYKYPPNPLTPYRERWIRMNVSVYVYVVATRAAVDPHSFCDVLNDMEPEAWKTNNSCSPLQVLCIRALLRMNTLAQIFRVLLTRNNHLRSSASTNALSIFKICPAARNLKRCICVESCSLLLRNIFPIIGGTNKCSSMTFFALPFLGGLDN